MSKAGVAKMDVGIYKSGSDCKSAGIQDFFVRRSGDVLLDLTDQPVLYTDIKSSDALSARIC